MTSISRNKSSEARRPRRSSSRRRVASIIAPATPASCSIAATVTSDGAITDEVVNTNMAAPDRIGMGTPRTPRTSWLSSHGSWCTTSSLEDFQIGWSAAMSRSTIPCLPTELRTSASSSASKRPFPSRAVAESVAPRRSATRTTPRDIPLTLMAPVATAGRSSAMEPASARAATVSARMLLAVVATG